MGNAFGGMQHGVRWSSEGIAHRTREMSTVGIKIDSLQV